MSEETEVPIVCDDCGGNLTNAGGTIDDLFSMALGEDRPHYWHMEQSGCIASLNERLTAATKRAEAAEAKLRDVAYWHEAWKEAEAERDALRKVVADVRAIKKIDSPCLDGENSDWVDGWQYGYQAALEDVRECITAASPALAVQP